MLNEVYDGSQIRRIDWLIDSKESSSTCPQLCCSCCHQNYWISSLFSYSLHWLKTNERIKCKILSLYHIQISPVVLNLLKLVNFFSYALFFYSLHIILLRFLLWPLVTLLSRVVLKLQTDLSIILLLFCRTVCRLIYVMLLITSLLLLY